MQLTYRDREEWLKATDQVCQALALQRVPDHATLCRMSQCLRPTTLERRHRAPVENLGWRKISSRWTAPATAPRRRVPILRAAAAGCVGSDVRGHAVGTRSLLVLAGDKAQERGSDTRCLARLRRAGQRSGQRVERPRQCGLVANRGRWTRCGGRRGHPTGAAAWEAGGRGAHSTRAVGSPSVPGRGIRTALEENKDGTCGHQAQVWRQALPAQGGGTSS